MDVISDIAFGEPLGFLTNDSDMYDYCKTFDTQMPMAMLVTVYPWISQVLQWPIIKNALPSDKDVLGFGKIMALVTFDFCVIYRPNWQLTESCS